MSDHHDPWIPPYPGLADNVQAWVRGLYSFYDDRDLADNDELGYFYRFAPQSNDHYYGDLLRRSQSFLFRYIQFRDQSFPYCEVCGSSNLLYHFRCYFCNRVCADHDGSMCYTYIYNLRVLGYPNPGQPFGRGMCGPEATEVKM